MNQLLLFVVVVLINFAWLAMSGMFQWWVFLFFLLIALGALLKELGRSKGKTDSKD